jgi:hypothetical protein
MSSEALISCSGGMLGRPIRLYILSNVGESVASAVGQVFDAPHRMTFGTRSPGVLRLNIESCSFAVPRIAPPMRVLSLGTVRDIDPQHFLNTLLTVPPPAN